MKNISFFLTSIIMIAFGCTAHAQIDLEDFNQAAQQYNERQAEERPPPVGTNSMAEARRNDAWREHWEATKNAAKEGMAYFDTKELNCIFLMVLYLDGYFNLQDEAEASGDCDLYGLQASAIALSTTIMYCPEYLYNLSDAEFEDFYESQLAPLIDAEYYDLEMSSVVEKWVTKMNRVGGKIYREQTPNRNSNPDEYDAHYRRPIWKQIRDLTLYFRPDFIIYKSVNIARKMEDLGCDER